MESARLKPEQCIHFARGLHSLSLRLLIGNKQGIIRYNSESSYEKQNKILYVSKVPGIS